MFFDIEKLEKLQKVAFDLLSVTIDGLLKIEIGDMHSFLKAEYKEFRTCSLKLPRRMGSTTLAIKLVKKYDNSVLFVHNEITRQTISSDSGINIKRIFNIKNKNSILGLRPDIIIVDTAFIISNKEVEDLYNCYPKAIVLLG